MSKTKCFKGEGEADRREYKAEDEALCIYTRYVSFLYTRLVKSKCTNISLSY